MSWIEEHGISWRHVGCDEAGRGCLAGPVVAAAVWLPEKYDLPNLTDSKVVNKKNRNRLRTLIEKQAVAFGIGICSPEEIDEHNILWASVLAMHKALEKVKETPDIILVDGNRFKPFRNWPHQTVVKGDALVAAISAASILAKTERDRIMEEYHDLHPQYNWKTNMGYPTIEHRKAIQQLGPTEIHRKSFRLLPENQQKLF
jgi:ribonuclease HII